MRVLVTVTIPCVLGASITSSRGKNTCFPQGIRWENALCASTAQGAHSDSTGKGGSEVLPENATGAYPKSIYKCIMGIMQSLILKSVCLGISWRLHFERRLSTEKMREILRIKLFPSSCGTNVKISAGIRNKGLGREGRRASGIQRGPQQKQFSHSRRGGHALQWHSPKLIKED